MNGQKSDLRAACRQKLHELEDGYIALSDEQLSGCLLAFEGYASAPAVFIYFSIGREVNTHGIIEKACASGKTVALPRVYGEGVMRFFRYSGRLRPGALGIPEPENDENELIPEKGDIMIVPALACSEAGYRLGQGGGYYDRYLADCPAQTVCLCREELMLEKIPTEWNDMPVNIVITEKRTIKIAGPEGPAVSKVL